MRIISGLLKGKKIPNAFKAEGVHPSSDLLKGVIFNVLGKDIEGKVFCDLYAGTGNVGFEALSRGASFCIFVEQSRLMASIINKLSHEFKMEDKTKIICGDVLKSIYNSSLFKNYNPDLISPDYIFPEVTFIDSPYDSNMAELTLKAIVENSYCKDNIYKDNIRDGIEKGIKDINEINEINKNLIIIQHNKKEVIKNDYPPYNLINKKIHGKTALAFYSTE